MPSALFVAHLDDKRQLTVKRIELNRDIQETIEGIFEHQYQSFTEGVEEEIPFVRDWKPDKDEILTIQADRIPDTNPFLEAAAKNPISVTRLNINPESISVKALFVAKGEGVLVQRFAISQIISRRVLLGRRGNVYHRVTEPTFAIDSALTFIIENGLVKFRNLQNVRSILDIGDVYREATEPEVRQFAEHSSFVVSDTDNFIELAGQPSRKIISAIVDAETLNKFTPYAIQQAAKETELDVEIDQNGKIVMPSDRRGVKEFLQFLDESRYRGPLSGTPLIAYFRRPA